MNFSFEYLKLREQLARASFFFLFPGFFLYQYSIAHGFIPPVLVQYFGNISALFLILLVPSVLKNSIPIWNSVSIVFLAVLAWWFFLAVLSFLVGLPLHFVDEMFFWSISNILFNSVCFLTALRLNIAGSLPIIVLSVISTGVLTLSDVGQFGIVNLQQVTVISPELIASYQGFARSLLVPILLLSATLFRSSDLFFLFSLFGLIVLFFNGARSEFVGLLLTLPFFSALYSILSVSRLFKSILFALAFFILCSLSVQYLPSQSRMFQLLDITSSGSYVDRADLFHSALSIIYQNPLMGSYGAHTQLGGTGNYAHNIISAWADLGLIGFLGYFFIFVAMWFAAMRNFLKHKDDLQYKAFFFFLFFVSVMISFSKDYGYMLIGFLVGLYTRYRSTTNLRHGLNSRGFVPPPF